MRVYYTTTEGRAGAILREGFTDRYEIAGVEDPEVDRMSGVWMSDCQLNAWTDGRLASRMAAFQSEPLRQQQGSLP